MDLRMLVTVLLLYPILVTPTSWYNVYTSAVATSYPALSQSNCPVSGSDAKSGICSNTCMRQYMTVVNLGPVMWTHNSTLTSATVVWTSAHWGDPACYHIPLTDQISEHSKTQGLPSSQAVALSQSLRDYHSVAPKTTSATVTNSATATNSVKQTTPGPTLAAQTRTMTSPWCMPDMTHHTAVASRDPRSGKFVTMVTPSNPFCDVDEPWGFDVNERLWMYQNKKDRSFHKKPARLENLGEMHLECWDYESCWDHCEEQKLHAKRIKNILLGVLGGLGGAALAGMIARKLMHRRERKREKREARTQKEWGGEASPRGVRNVDGSGDAANDAAASADEESARRAAASFRVAFNRVVMNRRDADASGSETVPPRDEGAVLRRAC